LASTLDSVKVRLLERTDAGLPVAELEHALKVEFGDGLIHDLLRTYTAWRNEKATGIDLEELVLIKDALDAQLTYLVPSKSGYRADYVGAELYRWIIPSLGGGLLGMWLLGPDGIGGTLARKSHRGIEKGLPFGA
jgi:hypothetical protein